jgi:recombination protein RecA
VKNQPNLAVLTVLSQCTEDSVPHKASALALALKQVEMSYGKGSIMQLGKSKPLTDIDVISTGSISLDHALGIGGLPKGRSVLVTVKCLL